MIAIGSVVHVPGEAGLWRVERRLGTGGQGDVFELRPEEGGRPVALKWYHEAAGTARQSEAIRRVIRMGAPGPMFLWPERFVPGEGGSFGYTMPLRPDAFRGISDLLRGKVDARPSLVLALCVELSTALLLLHAEGLCYRDISFGNVFFDPGTGAALVCDNDNVGIDGESDSGVLGTGGFMAPEVVRGEARPSADTDLHSLAVLIFYLTMVHHPLIGRRELELTAPEVRDELLGARPLFIFDPADDSNHPDPLTQPAPGARWMRYPERLRMLFVQAFTTGLHSPSQRVRESVWRGVLAGIRDRILVCPACGEENLTEEGIVASCATCRRILPHPVVLSGPFGGLVLNEGTRLTSHHVRRDFDLTTVLGTVVYDTARGLFGIRNDSPAGWTVLVPGGAPRPVPSGRTTAVVRDAVLHIEGVSFHVQAA